MNTYRAMGSRLSRSSGKQVIWMSALAMMALLCSRGTPAEASHAPPPTVTAAVDGILGLFAGKSVVALGDAHGMAQEEDFYSALVRDPRFTTEVGNVVVEFGSISSQDIIDRYVRGEDVPFTELRRVWSDTAGVFFPGEPAPLGLINFFASVRAANLGLPVEKRIRVWLTDPKVDWSAIHSFQDVQPLLRARDESEYRVLSEAILSKRKKALLIIGLAHLFGPHGPGPLSSRILEAYPGSLAIVAPFIGYTDPECNARALAQSKSWPTPALLAPVSGSSLESQLQLPGCNYIPEERLERMKKMAASPPPSGGVRLGGSGTGPAGSARLSGPGQGSAPGPGAAGPAPPSPAEMLAGETNILSGIKADAILYLGAPATLTQSPVDPSLYLDPAYYHEMERRAHCCKPFGAPLDWRQALEQNTVSPKIYEER